MNFLDIFSQMINRLGQPRLNVARVMTRVVGGMSWLVHRRTFSPGPGAFNHGCPNVR